MLVAKINPPAKKFFQVNPFEKTEITGEYMIAKCSQLVIGALAGSQDDEIRFEVRFGNIKYEKNPDGTNGNPMLDTVVVSRATFTADEMSDWGTDDTIVYQKIADKMGFNIVETIEMNMRFTA